MAAINDTIGGGRIRAISGQRDYLAAQSGPLRWFGGWFLAGGLIILLTGSTGTMSTVRLWVDSLATELALRRAVGASRIRIAGFVLVRALGIAAGGIGLGLFLFFAVLRGALGAVARDLPPLSTPTLAAATAFFGVICVIAALIPTMPLLRAPPSTHLE
jgi:ABC-type antimicrobial peptide transport system permease subunit